MPLAKSLASRIRRFESVTSTDSPAVPSKNGTKGSLDRKKISSPITLISTTNVLSYNAPDIAMARQLRKVSSISSSSSRSSDKDSDSSSIANASGEIMTDASSVGSSPTSPDAKSSPIMKELKQSPPQKSPRRAASSLELRTRLRKDDNLPEIPARAASHSKFAHEEIARKRSLQHIPGSRFARSASPPSLPPVIQEHRTSVDFFNGTIDTAHPFGKELEQLDEVAEEFGATIEDAEHDDDFEVMRKWGLQKFCAKEYQREIQPLFCAAFNQKVGWI